MNISECIDQLKDLRQNQEGFLDGKDADSENPFKMDIEAIDVAIKALIGEDTNVPATADDTNVGHESGGWISCEEKLPEDNRPVLCYVRDITGEGSGYIIGSCEHSEFWFLKIDGLPDLLRRRDRVGSGRGRGLLPGEA